MLLMGSCERPLSPRGRGVGVRGQAMAVAVIASHLSPGTPKLGAAVGFKARVT